MLNIVLGEALRSPKRLNVNGIMPMIHPVEHPPKAAQPISWRDEKVLRLLTFFRRHQETVPAFQTLLEAFEQADLALAPLTSSEIAHLVRSETSLVGWRWVNQLGGFHIPGTRLIAVGFCHQRATERAALSVLREYARYVDFPAALQALKSTVFSDADRLWLARQENDRRRVREAFVEQLRAQQVDWLKQLLRLAETTWTHVSNADELAA